MLDQKNRIHSRAIGRIEIRKGFCRRDQDPTSADRGEVAREGIEPSRNARSAATVSATRPMANRQICAQNR